MPLPFFLAAAAVIAGTAGVSNGVRGAMKMKDANNTLDIADKRHKRNINEFEKTNILTTEAMDELGVFELEILNSFEKFSDTIEKIQNRPNFKEYNRENVTLPKYDKEELKNVSVGAGVLLGGIGGAAAGTAGGFAAAGATTSAVMTLGTASTGTAIATLNGIAATNATLAAIGGGSIAAGGGGMALGTTILGASTLGVGLLVGGVIFNITGSKVSDKADEAYSEMLKAEKQINEICVYLNDLKCTANEYKNSLERVNEQYKVNFEVVSNAVNIQHKIDWNNFTKSEKIKTENCILLVGLLHKMCQVEIVISSNDENEHNTINYTDIKKSQNVAEEVLLNIKA